MRRLSNSNLSFDWNAKISSPRTSKKKNQQRSMSHLRQLRKRNASLVRLWDIPLGIGRRQLITMLRLTLQRQKLVGQGSGDFKFFQRIREWVKRGCHFHKHQSNWTPATRKKYCRWLEQELQELTGLKLNHEKAITLQGRIVKHVESWLVFTRDSRVPPTNNLAERTLRPLVIMRKICFGNRSRAGGQRMARIMTIKETARRHCHNPLELFYRLFTRPPDQVMKFLHKKTSAKKSMA